MSIRILTGTHDWTFGAGLANFATGQAEIQEDIQTRLLEWVNDCFFDLQAGVDWLARLDVGQQVNLEEECQTIILQTQGVTGVNSVSLNFDHESRNVTINYNVQTIYSTSFAGAVTQAAGG